MYVLKYLIWWPDDTWLESWQKPVLLPSNHGAQGPGPPSGSRTIPQTGSANPNQIWSPEGNIRHKLTPELQDQRSDFNETHIALINYPCRPLQGGNRGIIKYPFALA